MLIQGSIHVSKASSKLTCLAPAYHSTHHILAHPVLLCLRCPFSRSSRSSAALCSSRQDTCVFHPYSLQLGRTKNSAARSFRRIVLVTALQLAVNPTPQTCCIPSFQLRQLQCGACLTSITSSDSARASSSGSISTSLGTFREELPTSCHALRLGLVGHRKR